MDMELKGRIVFYTILYEIQFYILCFFEANENISYYSVISVALYEKANENIFFYSN